MKKFIINSTPLVVGILIALTIAALCTGDYKNDENPASSEIVEDTSLVDDSLNKNETSSDELVSEDFISSETTLEEIKQPDLTEESTEDLPSPDEVGGFDYIPMSQSLRDHVKLVSSFYEFDEELIYQIIYIESRFNPASYNDACVGLMQVHTGYSKNYLKIDDGLPFEVNENSDVYDPYVNIVVGVRVLDDWRRSGSRRGFSELNDWLCYYNMGWRYEVVGGNGYDQLVLGTDLNSIDFSSYKIVE